MGDTVRLAGVTGIVEAMTLRKTTVRDGDGTLYVIPNSQITTVANLSTDFSVATVNVSVDFSANPDEVMKAVEGDRHGRSQQRRVPRRVCRTIRRFWAWTRVKGSQMIFPVVFKTMANQQYGPMREFQRRVRLALEENHLLPGDPNRIFNSFTAEDSGCGSAAGSNPRAAQRITHEPKDRNRTQRSAPTLKPQETNPLRQGIMQESIGRIGLGP